MNNDKPVALDDPTNRIVCVFETMNSAQQARFALIESGFQAERVKLLSEDDARTIDTSAKWFADTDKELKKFQRELRRGFVALSVPVGNAESRESIIDLLQRHGAHHVTHFGEWITEVMR